MATYSNGAASGARLEPSSTQSTQRERGWGDYGGNPLAHQWSNVSDALGPDAAFFQPGLFKRVPDAARAQANPVPLGLAGFALTTFVLSMINLDVRGVSAPYIVVGPSLAYGGLVQLLAGMWLVAQGNTFGAWALSSYGGFWISLGIIFTPGGFGIAEGYGGGSSATFYTALGFYIYGWMIFTILVWLATLRATILLNFLLLSVWLAFLCLATGYVYNSGGETAKPQPQLNLAGGVFGILAAFDAWIIMTIGLLTRSNSWIVLPEFHFPWSPETRVKQGKSEAIGKLRQIEEQRFSAREQDPGV